MRDANANIIDDDDEHDCIMLNNEEGWNRNAREGFKLKDFYLIHHLAINIPDLHFLKSEVEDASHNLKDGPFRICLQRNIGKSNRGTFFEITIRL